MMIFANRFYRADSRLMGQSFFRSVASPYLQFKITVTLFLIVGDARSCSKTKMILVAPKVSGDLLPES